MERERTMSKSVLTVSPDALVHQSEPKTNNPTPKSAVPVGWDIEGFQSEHVYVRKLTESERQTVRRKHTGQPFDWNKQWYGVFSVQTGQILCVSDSRKKMYEQMRNTTAVELYIN
jgi:hypothetical protein